MPANPYPTRPYPDEEFSDRIERKFTVYRATLLAGKPDIMVRKQEEAFYAGAEAMFDIIAFEIADELGEEEAMHEMSRLKNAIWRKAMHLTRGR